MAHQPPLPPPLTRSRRWRHAWRELAQAVLQAICLYALLAGVVGRFQIQQISTEPNFHAGQLVAMSRWEHLVAPWWALGVRIAHAEGGDIQAVEPLGLRRGQVVVINASSRRGGVPLVKRVIGLPGDTLAISQGRVLIGGVPLAEPYVQVVATTCSSYCGPLTLEHGMYYVIGDNRPNSQNSRAFGPVPGRDIIGHIIVRFWPLTSFEIYP